MEHQPKARAAVLDRLDGRDLARMHAHVQPDSLQTRSPTVYVYLLGSLRSFSTSGYAPPTSGVRAGAADGPCSHRSVLSSAHCYREKSAGVSSRGRPDESPVRELAEAPGQMGRTRQVLVGKK